MTPTMPTFTPEPDRVSDAMVVRNNPAVRPAASLLTGRIGRLQCWASAMWGALLVMVLTFAVGLVALLLPHQWSHAFQVVSLILVMYVMLPLVLLRLAMRRLHDLGRSGGFALLLLVPLVNVVLYGVLLVVAGQNQPNRYGPPPPPVTTLSLLGAVTVPVLMLLIFLFGQPDAPDVSKASPAAAVSPNATHRNPQSLGAYSE